MVDRGCKFSVVNKEAGKEVLAAIRIGRQLGQGMLHHPQTAPHIHRLVQLEIGYNE